MKLYHGTAARWSDIESRGIRPRSMKAGNWKDHPSHPEHVYLTDAYPYYFARAAASHLGRTGGLILEVDTDRLDPDNLFADEDPIAQVLHRSGEEGTLGEHTRAVRDDLEGFREGGCGHEWSLRMLGTCSHRGAIPASAITRAWRLSSLFSPRWQTVFHDPSLSLMSYRIMGETLRAGLAWLTLPEAERTVEAVPDTWAASAILLLSEDERRTRARIMRENVAWINDHVHRVR